MCKHKTYFPLVGGGDSVDFCWQSRVWIWRRPSWWFFLPYFTNSLIQSMVDQVNQEVSHDRNTWHQFVVCPIRPKRSQPPTSTRSPPEYQWDASPPCSCPTHNLLFDRFQIGASNDASVCRWRDPQCRSGGIHHDWRFELDTVNFSFNKKKPRSKSG